MNDWHNLYYIFQFFFTTVNSIVLKQKLKTFINSIFNKRNDELDFNWNGQVNTIISITL